MRDHIVHATEASFDTEVLQADRPVLVDYWAEWCGPCRSIAPLLEELAERYSGQLKVVKVDVDANAGIAPRFGIRGIPTLMLFSQGEVRDTRVGALSAGDLHSFVDQHLG